jgi:hypothetical protein
MGVVSDAELPVGAPYIQNILNDLCSLRHGLVLKKHKKSAVTSINMSHLLK